MKPLFLIAILALTGSMAFGQAATVTWTNTHQTMDGFGGMTLTYGTSLTSSQADLFFSPTAGIGLEFVRTSNTPDSSIPDLTTLQEAVARGAKVELSFLS